MTLKRHKVAQLRRAELISFGVSNMEKNAARCKSLFNALLAV
jgi:hypothetical protein